MLVSQKFLYKNMSCRYKHLVVNGDRTIFTNEKTSAGKKYHKTLICQMIDDFLIDNIYINAWVTKGIGTHIGYQGGSG